VQRHAEVLQKMGLRLAAPEQAHRRGQRQAAGDHRCCVVVAGEDEDGNPRVRQPAHGGGEVQAGAHVLPLAVVEVAGDDHEIDRLVDRRRDQVVEGGAGCAANLVMGHPFVLDRP
jgi:hypothetical protein